MTTLTTTWEEIDDDDCGQDNARTHRSQPQDMAKCEPGSEVVHEILLEPTARLGRTLLLSLKENVRDKGNATHGSVVKWKVHDRLSVAALTATPTVHGEAVEYALGYVDARREWGRG